MYDKYDDSLPVLIDPTVLSHHVGCLTFEFDESSKAIASIGLLKVSLVTSHFSN